MSGPTIDQKTLLRLKDLADALAKASNSAPEGDSSITLHLSPGEAKKASREVRVVANEYGSLIQAIEEQGFTVTVDNEGVFIDTPEDAILRTQLRVLSTMLEQTLTCNMGGKPKGEASPPGGWDRHDKAAQAAIMRSNNLVSQRLAPETYSAELAASLAHGIQSEFSNRSLLTMDIMNAFREVAAQNGGLPSDTPMADNVYKVRDKIVQRLEERIFDIASQITARANDPRAQPHTSRDEEADWPASPQP